ncbi:hypothetical protein B0H13DRAFT_2302303 [Mycena leptocephala]|nr:hypothetical protein B0H13DRAFT_2302303 [Mycena leptocephala]
MSLDELEALARRHKAYAADLRAALKRQKVPDVDQGWSDVKGNASGTKGNAPETPGCEEELAQPAANWGDIFVLQNFSGADARELHQLSVNYEEINHMVERGKNTGHTDSFFDISALKFPSPKTQSSREDSKSPKAKTAETLAVLPKATSKADEPVSIAPPTVAPRLQPTTLTPEAEFVNIEPQKTEVDVPVPILGANNASEGKSGPTAEEIVALVMQKINELQVGQGAGKEPLKARADSPHRTESSASRAREVPKEESFPPKARETHIPRGKTPGRFAADNFFEKALRGVPMSSAMSRGSPEDPSDSSSWDSDFSSDRSSHNGHGSSWRRSSSPRLSSKRRRGHDRNRKMLLKPIPPSRYNGEPNANAIQRFARESKTCHDGSRT